MHLCWGSLTIVATVKIFMNRSHKVDPYLPLTIMTALHYRNWAFEIRIIFFLSSQIQYLADTRFYLGRQVGLLLKLIQHNIHHSKLCNGKKYLKETVNRPIENNTALLITVANKQR